MFRVEEILRATAGSLCKGKILAQVRSVSTDSRTLKSGELFIPLRGKNFDGHNFIWQVAKRGAAAVLIEENFYRKNKARLEKLSDSLSCIIVSDTLKALGDLALYHRKRFNLPLIALTGSTGKTTTKEMIASVLEGHYRILKNTGTENNLIGVPLNLLQLDIGCQIACLEFGTSVFGEISRLTEIARPTVGLITNIGHAHLEGLKTKAGVFKEKSQLLFGLQNPGIAFINYDDPYLRKLEGRIRYLFRFGKEKAGDFLAQGLRNHSGMLQFRLRGSKEQFRLKTAGLHNVYNALAAIGVGIIFGISLKSIARALARFQFPNSRFNILKISRFTIVDDTYNSNPLSLRSALESLQLIDTPGKKVLVLADMLELGRESKQLHQEIGEFVARADVDFLLTFGNLAALIAKGAIHKGFDKRRVFSSRDMNRVRSKLSQLVKSGDTVLVKGSHAMQMNRVVEFLSRKKKRGRMRP